MKLKPVVASLLALGFVSLACPGLAHDKVARAQSIVDQNSAVSEVPTCNWFDRISIGARASVLGIWGSRDPAGAFTDIGHSSDFYVNNVNFLVKARLSDWFKATVDVAYDGQPIYRPHFDWHQGDIEGFERHIDRKLYVSEAYITMSDFAKNPFYLVLGQKAMPFGDYNDLFVPTPIMSFTQLLSQVVQPGIIGGVSTDFGLYASVYAFRGVTFSGPDNDEDRVVGNDDDHNHSAGNIRNFGAKIGYADNLGSVGMHDTKYHVNLGWIRNILDGDHSVLAASDDRIGPQWYMLQHDSVGGLSLHGDVHYKHFGLNTNFVGALQNILEYHNSDNHHEPSSHLWAADITADYNFNSWDRCSNISLGYQLTGNGSFLLDYNRYGVELSLPKYRLLADYRVELVKHVTADIAVAHNHSYSYEEHDSDEHHHDHSRTSNLALARLSVAF